MENVFNLNNFQLGTIISVYFLMSVIFLFIWIYLFGKYSKFKIFLLSSFLWVLGSILFSFSQNYVHLLIFSAIIGCSIEASAIFVLLMLFQISPNQKQGKVLALFMIIQGAGGIFGVFLTATFEDLLGFSWNFVFLFIGIISLIWVIMSGVLFLKTEKFNILIEPYFEKGGYILNFKLFRESLQRKTNLNLIIIIFYSTPFIFFLNLWIQKYFHDYHSLTQMEAAISYIFLSGGEFLGIIFGGFLFDKYYSRDNYNKIFIIIFGIFLSIPLLFIGFLIFWKKPFESSGVGLIDIALNLFHYTFTNPLIFVSYIMLFIGFVCFGLIYPFFLILINDCNNDNEKGTILGIKNLIEIMGQALSPIIGGLIADNFSILIVMLFVPLFLIIPLIHLILMRKVIEADFFSINKDLAE